MKALLLSLLALGFAHAGQQSNLYEPNIDHSRHRRPEKNGFLQGDDQDNVGKTDNNTMLYIHLIAHSHDDLGWKKTVDGYFSGGRPEIQNAYVEMTLDTTIAELIKNPSRKYTQVEMKFFEMWWREQTDDVKAQVRYLAQNGQLEFVNAGWSMHDEACTHVDDMIDNMMAGHQYLMKEVGVKPRIGWTIDPFGHSNTNSRLFAEMGFDAVIFARGDYQDSERRMNESSMQWLWRPTWNHLGKRSQILAFMMIGNVYWQPHGFDFQGSYQGDGPFIDNPNSTEFNADVKAQEFVAMASEAANHFRTNHIMYSMGGDFQFINAHLQFKNIDRFISYVNARYPNVTLLYSTPGQYIDSLYNANISWPVRYDDMFPYADKPEDFWTGYFTSRAGAKWQVREGQAFQHATNWLYSLKAIDQNATDEQISEILGAKDAMLDAMGIYQHHDAITGTAKQYVADDYTHRLFLAKKANADQYGKMINKLSYKTAGLDADYWSQCAVNNGTYLDCPIVEHLNRTFVVAVQNPSMQAVYYQRIKVPHSKYSAQVWSPTANAFVAVNSSVLCHAHAFENGVQITDCDMWIDNKVDYKSVSWIQVVYDPFTPVNPTSGLKKFEYQTETSRGSLFKVFDDDGTQRYMAFQVRYYVSDDGNDNYPNTDNVPSGAYIFKPAKGMQYSLPYVSVQSYDVQYGGPFMQQMNIYYTDSQSNRSARVIMRAFAKNPAIEVEVRLDPIPASATGTEVTVNFFAYNMDTNNTFYTDSNAMDMQKRILNYREDWNLTTNQNVSANYYPINQAIVITDEAKNLSFVVTNDRSQGGGVFDNSRVEFMHNRRLFLDDYRGVEEPLSENGTFGNGITIQATYTLHFVNKSKTYSKQRFQQLVTDDPLQYLFAFNYTIYNVTAAPSQSANNNDHILQSSNGVPAPIKIQTYPLQRNYVLVRVTNIGDLFDYPANSTLADTVAYVDLNALAKNFYAQANGQSAQLTAINILETQLTGVASQTEWKKSRYQWKGLDDGQVVEPVLPKDLPNNIIALSAQRIRVFIIEFVPLNAQTAKVAAE